MFKIEMLRILKTPINWIFSVIFPLFLTILFGLLFGKEYMDYGFFGIILLISLTGTIVPISIYICSDKIEKRIKYYLIIKGAIRKYTFALYFVNLILFMFVSFVVSLISIFAFNVSINVTSIIALITFPLISYSLAFIIAVVIGTSINSISTVIPFSMLIFYLLLFLSGFIIPLQELMSKNQKFYYIEVLSPFGCLYLFYSHIMGAIELSGTKLSIASLSIISWTVVLFWFLILSTNSYKK